jgi:hypothetical protein
MKNWLYKETEVTEESIPEGSEGFVYKITHTPTGKYYIGKKSLWAKRTLPPLKGKKRKRRVIKESDWKKYHSSNDWIKSQVKEGNKDNFKREIIQFCPSKKSLTYYELRWQMHYDVLADDNCLNENLLGKFYRKDLVL